MKPLKLKRHSLVNIAMLVGVVVALVIVVPSIESIDFASVQHEFATATWAWVVAAALLYPLILTSEATALLGAENADPPLVPTVLMQLSTKFVGVITPDGVGGTALQVRYFSLVGVPVASATSAVILSSTLASLMQLVVLIPCAALSSSSLDLGAEGSSTILIVIAVVAAAVGVMLLVPKLRGKVVPVAERALSDLWAVIRDPHKALKLFGRNLGTTLAYPALLGLCLLAFGQSLGYPQLFLTQVGAGILSSVAPVPGGIGVQEAALTGALTGFGVPANPAVAAVLLYRGITFTAPGLSGFPVLTWLRRKGYA